MFAGVAHILDFMNHIISFVLSVLKKLKGSYAWGGVRYTAAVDVELVENFASYILNYV